jgi:filamentous hemagglutinin
MTGSLSNIRKNRRHKSHLLEDEKSREAQFPSMRFSMLVVIVASLFGSVSINVNAQMVAYKNGGPAPTIDRTANNLPIVQINTPDKNGLSHNRYTDFNVGPEDALLNNSATSVATQLGGYVQGNPNLTALPNGMAKVVLNEVLGTNRANLNGYIEVAGQRADVIIANPNGLSVNGFGVINGGNVTLTTGVPQFAGDGSLSAYRVTQGDITVGSGGINAQQNDGLKLLARSVRVNDKIWSKELNMTTGANLINYGDGSVQVITGTDGVPTVGLDVAALGGLYANRVFLVGTEKGLGVNSLGDMSASAGNIDISHTGKV